MGHVYRLVAMAVFFCIALGLFIRELMGSGNGWEVWVYFCAFFAFMSVGIWEFCSINRRERGEYMKNTKIEWCDMTWNPVTGCQHGCKYCYARRIADRFSSKDPDAVIETANCNSLHSSGRPWL